MKYRSHAYSTSLYVLFTWYYTNYKYPFHIVSDVLVLEQDVKQLVFRGRKQKRQRVLAVVQAEVPNHCQSRLPLNIGALRRERVVLTPAARRRPATIICTQILVRYSSLNRTLSVVLVQYKYADILVCSRMAPLKLVRVFNNVCLET